MHLPQSVIGFRPALRTLLWVATGVLMLAGVGAGQATTRITLDQAVDLARQHSPAIQAARTQIPQNQAQEITAGLRPNPTLSWDSQFLPFFNPSQFNADNISQNSQFDMGLGYLFERGGKRQRRLEAARDQTAVTRAQVDDTQRGLDFSVGQQFINALLAESNVQFAQEALKSFQQTGQISEQRYKAGDISEGDLLKITLQMLQFQTDLSAAELARVQALANLRQLIGYAALPENYDVAGDLTYAPVQGNLDDFKVLALQQRPDLIAARRGITAAQSQYSLAKANGKWDLNTTFNYSHVSGLSSGTFFWNLQLPIFNRNQGEVARTNFVIEQARFTETAATETVLNDVRNGYEAVRSSDKVVQLYLSGYLKQSQQSLDINRYAYQRGATSLLDYLDAERSYRQTQLAYRQALATYMTAVEQLRQAVGTRNLP